MEVRGRPDETKSEDLVGRVSTKKCPFETSSVKRRETSLKEPPNGSDGRINRDPERDALRLKKNEVMRLGGSRSFFGGGLKKPGDWRPSIYEEPQNER